MDINAVVTDLTIRLAVTEQLLQNIIARLCIADDQPASVLASAMQEMRSQFQTRATSGEGEKAFINRAQRHIDLVERRIGSAIGLPEIRN